MKQSLNLLLILSLFILFSACGGSKDLSSTDTGDMPEWYLTTPTATDYIFSAASSTSRDMDLAISKASTEARAKLARTLAVKVNSMQKKFEEEIGEGENSEYLSQFTQATKTVVSQEMSGSQISKKKLVKDGKNWRAYVLAKYPVGAAQKAFLNKISNNNNLYTRVRATEAFAELESDVYKYDNPDQIESPKVAAAVTLPAIIDVDKKEETPIAEENQIINHNEFSYELISCTMENRIIKCSLIIKNNSENDLTLNLGIGNTKIFDESGNEYSATKTKLANTSSKEGWRYIGKQIIPNIPTQTEFIFENVSSKVTAISLFSIYLTDDRYELKFRDVVIEK